MAIWTLNQLKAIHITSYLEMQFMGVNAMRIARNYRSRYLNSAHIRRNPLAAEMSRVT